MAAKRPKVKPEKSTLKYKKTSAQTRTAKKPPKTSAGKAEGASKGKTPKARKVSKTPKSTVAEYNKPTGKPTAKTSKAKVKPSVKPLVKSTVRSLAGKIIRKAPAVIAASAIVSAVPAVFRHLFPKKDPATISEKAMRIQRLMTRTGVKTGPETDIHGARSTKLGKQEDVVKPKKAVTLMPSPVPRTSDKEKLGQNKPRLTRPKKEVYTTELRIPPKLSKIKDMGKVEDTRAKKPSTSKTDPASTDGPSPAPKRLNENASPTKGKTDIKNRFDKFMQDSSRADRHLGAPKKKPLGMEDAFWDGSSWVR